MMMQNVGVGHGLQVRRRPGRTEVVDIGEVTARQHNLPRRVALNLEGVPADETEELRNKVLKIAALLAIVALVRNFILLYSGYYLSFFEVLFAVSVPYCGYEGAKRRSRSLLNCFWTCNAGGLLILSVQLAISIQYVMNPNQHYAGAEHHNTTSTHAEHLRHYQSFEITNLITSSILFAIQTQACHWGRQLTYDPLLDFDIVTRQAFRLAPVQLQPHINLAEQRVALAMYAMASEQQTANNAHNANQGVSADTLQKIPVYSYGDLACSGTKKVKPSSAVESKYQHQEIDLEAGEGGAILCDRTLEDAVNDTIQFEQAACTICLDEFSTTDEVRVLPCHHVYHRCCIDEWLSKRQTCPLCQAILKSS